MIQNNISVIIPLYNAEKYIGKALDSCLQLSEVKEIIVVDDASPDGAAEIVKSYAGKEPRIRLLTHADKKNHGAGASRNLGIENATCEFIAFLDADDFYLPNRFEKDRKIFDAFPDADGCYNALGVYFYSRESKSVFEKHFSKNKEMTSVWQASKPTPENLFPGLIGKIKDYGYFSLDCLTIKRESLLNSKLKMNENLRLHQDTDFIIKLAWHCKLYPSEISRPTAMRGVHDENRITRNFQKHRTEKSLNRFKLWDSLLQWGEQTGLDTDLLGYINGKRDYFRLAMSPKLNFRTFLKEIIKNPLILKSQSYPAIHFMFLEKYGSLISTGLFKIRNIFVKTNM